MAQSGAVISRAIFVRPIDWPPQIRLRLCWIYQLVAVKNSSDRH